MGFPHIVRYFLRFRHSDQGLLPEFSYFKWADTLLDTTTVDAMNGRLEPRPHPQIEEIGGGTYYFDWQFMSKDDPDVVFEVDGTSDIPTEEVRWISDTISPRDHFLDEPVSQVNDDVWKNATDYIGSSEGTTKGELVQRIGDANDDKFTESVFGRLVLARADIKGDSLVETSGPAVAGKDGQQIFTAVETIAGTVTDAMGNLVPPDNAGIAAIKAKTDLLPNDMGTFLTTITSQMARVLGMLHENSVLDKIRYDGTTNNLKTARLRTYANSDAAAAAKAAGDNLDYETDMVGQYSIVCEYSGDNMTSYLVVKEFPLT